MRSLLVFGAVWLLGCGSSDRSAEPRAAVGSAGQAHAAGGSGGRTGEAAITGGGGGNATIGRGGQPAIVDPPAAGEGGGSSAGASGQSDATGEGGATAGASGSAEEQGGAPTAGAGKSGTGGRGPKGGSAGAAPVCDCDAAHDCVDSECVIKPECDCAALKVECSPLSTALRDKFACPIEVQCGTCDPGQLCVAPDDPKKFGVRLCLTSSATSCTAQANASACTDPDCPVEYSGCAEVALPATGKLCPVPIGAPTAWWCGPPL